MEKNVIKVREPRDQHENEAGNINRTSERTERGRQTQRLTNINDLLDDKSVYTERDSPGGGNKIGEDGKEREITKESKFPLFFTYRDLLVVFPDAKKLLLTICHRKSELTRKTKIQIMKSIRMDQQMNANSSVKRNSNFRCLSPKMLPKRCRQQL
uniref:Uncharacterized protein n=1 Tax=Tetranychus urticae TaxID=32264 RepID=T1L1X7_TETUR